MSNKTVDTKDRILNIAFELFTKKGYDNTTVDEIIKGSDCSKATFYHYFSGKSSLLSCASPKLNDTYTTWCNNIDPNMNSIEKLRDFNHVLLNFNEFYCDFSVISALYAAQVTTKNEKILSESLNIYMNIIRDIIKDGQIKNEIRNDISFIDLTKMYTAVQRGVIYEWCFSSGTYSLRDFGVRTMDMFITSFAPIK